MSANIFISHAREDRKVATTLCAALESRGFKCWIATRDIEPGENFQIAIVRAIRSAKMMLLVFTSNSNSSEEMSKELALASQQKLIVVPLRVEDVTPNEAFAYEFATRQWIDFFADWEAAINQLSVRIGNAMPPEPVEVAAPPPLVEAAAPSEAAVATPPVLAALTPPAESPKPPPTAAPEPVAARQPSPAATPEPVAAKPAPAPVARTSKIEPAKPAAPSRPVASAPADAAARPKSRVGLFAAIAAALLLVAGLGLVVPNLIGKKPIAQASVAPTAKPLAAATAPSAAPPPAVFTTASASDTAAPEQLNAAGNTIADPNAPPVAKPHAHRSYATHSQPQRAEVPY
ncbi:MAG: toll/interleukin-1 receptor domain-containing protein [Caulobacterales bacterium]